VTGRARDDADLRVEIEELFADLWQVPRFSGQRHRFRPQCDCFRTNDPPALHVVVELPGADAGSVRISATGRTLVISGRRERPHVAGARYRQMEIEYGEFERRLELGEDIDVSQASATYEHGLLRIFVPLEARSE
jgi:HSP20 family protein